MKDVTYLFSEMRGALLPSAFACRPPFAFLLFPLLRTSRFVSSRVQPRAKGNAVPIANALYHTIHARYKRKREGQERIETTRLSV